MKLGEIVCLNDISDEYENESWGQKVDHQVKSYKTFVSALEATFSV